MTLVKLELRASLLRADELTEWVYFPVSALCSMITTDSEGQSVETSMVGLEGAVGLIEGCSSRTSRVDGLVQIDGEAWRAPVAFCKMLFQSEPVFAAQLLRYAELQLTEARRSAFCQAVHRAPRRLARWLAESVERSAGRNPMPITQEFLAAMLGVQRTSVTMHAQELQRGGAISYKRGLIHVTDWRRLSQEACS